MNDKPLNAYSRRKKREIDREKKHSIISKTCLFLSLFEQNRSNIYSINIRSKKKKYNKHVSYICPVIHFDCS
jgi:hypothetical protein